MLRWVNIQASSALRERCGHVVCLATPVPFYAAGTHYLDFVQTSDDEVLQLLTAAGMPAG